MDVRGGVIDPDYRGAVKVILHNYGSEQIVLKKSTRIAQLILEKIDEAETEIVQNLDHTSRDTMGFGSTGIEHTPPAPSESTAPHNAIPYDPEELAPCINNIEIERPQNVCMDMNGDGPYLDIMMTVRGNHPSLGMNIKINAAGQPILIDCKSGTPACRIPKWRSTLRNARVKEINKEVINNIQDIHNAVAMARSNKIKCVECKFATESKVEMHPQLGIPQLHFDQLNVIAEHHQEARQQGVFYQDVAECIPDDHTVIMKVDTKERLTRKKLLQRPDWEDWKQSEYNTTELIQITRNV